MGWNFAAANAYIFFPAFGLLAYSILWSQYMVAGLQRAGLMRHIELGSYFRYTGYAVLVALVLHPGILVYQLFRDGYGLPPSSYEHFVAPGLAWVTLVGTVSLFVLLAFELHRWFGKTAWWKYVIAAGDVAMLAIFYHSLRLGIQLQSGWFRYMWWFYGLTLMVVLAQKYALILLRRPNAKQTTDW